MVNNLDDFPHLNRFRAGFSTERAAFFCCGIMTSQYNELAGKQYVKLAHTQLLFDIPPLFLLTLGLLVSYDTDACNGLQL